MKTLEEKFEQELIKNLDEAKNSYGCNLARMMKLIETHGGVKTAKGIIRKGCTSDGFEKLQQAKRLDLTMEAAVINSQYAELFTDDEVNFCYEILCECEGFFGSF